MKRKIALILSALMIMSFSACTSGDSAAESGDTALMTEKASEETKSEEATETEAATEAETETEAESEAETEAETEAESEVASETEAATEAETTAAAETADTFKGDGFTLNINSDKWVDYSKYIELIGGIAEESVDMNGVTAEDIVDMTKGVYMYKDNLNINFNIGVTDLGADVSTIGLDVYKDIIKMQYDASEGVAYVGDEIFKVNGKDCLKVTVETSAEQYDSDNIVSQYIFLYGTSQYVLTYTAGRDHYDAGIADFEEIVNSMNFTY